MPCCLTLLWKIHSVVTGYSEGTLLPSFFMALSPSLSFSSLPLASRDYSLPPDPFSNMNEGS